MILCESNAKKQGEDSLTQTCGRQTDRHAWQNHQRMSFAPRAASSFGAAVLGVVCGLLLAIFWALSTKFMPVCISPSFAIAAEATATARGNRGGGNRDGGTH